MRFFLDGTVIKFRLCRVKLDNGEYETLATNLDKLIKIFKKTESYYINFKF